jgi:tripartite-type tricarboxylate transporter receptor subunit TctC
MNRILALVGALLLVPSIAGAQTYPTKPVRMIVPFAPGGATDIIARLVTTKMTDVWKQSVIVESRPGAGTVVGTEAVARAQPDGYTMGFVVTAHVINPSLRTNMPYDTLKDLVHVTQVSQQHIVLAAHPKFPANNVAELLAYAKKSGQPLQYATSGAGTALHLGMELLGVRGGIKLEHIAYKGGAPAQLDAVAGRVPLVMEIHYAAQAHLKDGKLKPIAMFSPQRPAYAKDIPVVAETLPGVTALSIVGIVAPAATPRDLVRRISADIGSAVRNSDLTEKMQAQGMDPVGSTPDEFEALVKTEIAKWGPIVKASGAKAD